MRSALPAIGVALAFAVAGCGSSPEPDPPPLAILPLASHTQILSSAPAMGDDTDVARFRAAVIAGTPHQSSADLMRSELRLIRRSGWGSESSKNFGGPPPGHFFSVAATSPGAVVMPDSPKARFYVALTAATSLRGAQQAADQQSMQGVARAVHRHRPVLLIFLGHGRHD